MAGITPSPPVPSFSAGEIVTQGKLNAIPDHIGQLFTRQLGGFRTRKPICAISATSAQSIATNADVLMTFQSEDIDTDSMFSAPGTAMVIRTAGIYLLEFQMSLGTTGSATNANAVLWTKILVNGAVAATDAVGSVFARFPPTTGSACRCAAVVPLDVGAQVTFLGNQNCGVAVSTLTTSGGSRAFAEWLAPLAPMVGASQ